MAKNGIKLSFDLLSPLEITKKAETIGEIKAKGRTQFLVVMGIMAGMFIGLAGEFYTLATFDTGTGASITRLLGGFAFSLGLVLVVIAGAELFTGNTLLIISYMSRKISLRMLMRNWGIVYLSNFVGAITIGLIVFFAEQWKVGEGSFGAYSVYIAANKVNATFMVIFLKAVLANVLVVLSVWLSTAGRTVTDKILGIVLPIIAFVSSGFEHCIANMYFIPFGILAKGHPEILELVSKTYPNLDLSNLTVQGFLVKNLLPATLGNIVGGVCFVGLLYWYVYIACEESRVYEEAKMERRQQKKQLEKEKMEEEN